jgi:hypothetical protein
MSDVTETQSSNWSIFSPRLLPDQDRALVEFLLLMPVAALIICVIRNVVGLQTFGTFSPALLGLAFRDVQHVAAVGIFLLLLLAGWLMRRSLDRLHLLQVPRTSFMLSVVVSSLILIILVSNHYQVRITNGISLIPLVIMTGIVERCWLAEEENGTRSSFRTLSHTVLVASLIAGVTSRETLTDWLINFPESTGLVMAGQLILGRYTGYRLTELYRFRDILVRDGEG